MMHSVCQSTGPPFQDPANSSKENRSISSRKKSFWMRMKSWDCFESFGVGVEFWTKCKNNLNQKRCEWMNAPTLNRMTSIADSWLSKAVLLTKLWWPNFDETNIRHSWESALAVYHGKQAAARKKMMNHSLGIISELPHKMGFSKKYRDQQPRFFQYPGRQVVWKERRNLSWLMLKIVLALVLSS